ncbi:hypothetical protein [Aurantimonas sp. 22II-16-19i]|uniref:hypothetical protein n=1 Tax=Aurantimonas sp. 22II-16-19i TaxID=1317114 RepID=UPI00111C7C7A|nr:hypothetical protein [Aurantimonas sp. 22II-16-19i]
MSMNTLQPSIHNERRVPTASTDPASPGSTGLALADLDPIDAATGTAAPSAAPDGDPAVIVGLALRHARMRHPEAVLPTPITDRLQRLAALGDPTCRLVADWMEQRHAASSATRVTITRRGEIR